MNKQLKDLSNKIHEYDYHYYIKGKPKVSNEVYDGLYEKLKYYEEQQKIPEYLRASNRVGVFSILNNVPHLTKMYSMNKTTEIKTIMTFLSQFRHDTDNVLVDFKHDGIAVELRYINGQPSQAISRGDGVIGKDISRNVFRCVDIPTSIPHKGNIQVEGEIVIPKTKDNKHLNLCSVVSGMLMGKKLPNMESRPKFIAYNFHVENSLNQRNYLSTLHVLSDIWKFTTVSCCSVAWEDLTEYIHELELSKDKHEYQCDGLCVKINESDLRFRSGYTKKYPKYQIAYKWQPPIFSSKLLKVVWQVGSTGRLTPIGTIEPVYTNNKKFSKVNLHTVGKIKELDLTIGADINVTIKGGLIPKIIEVTSKSDQEITIPDVCPVCNEVVLYQGKYLVCTNKCASGDK